MTDLDAIRSLAGQFLDGPNAVRSTSTNGNTLALFDTTALQNGVYGKGMFRGWWVLFKANTSTNRERIIDTYDPAQGQLTWLKELGATAASLVYELYSLQPTKIETAINRALETMYTKEEVTVAPAANNDIQISLSSLTWLTSDDQFVELEVREGTTSNQYERRAVRGAYIDRDQAAYTLHLTGERFLTTATLYLIARRSYYSIGALSSGSSTTNANVNWAAWEAVVEILKTYMMSTGMQSDEVWTKKLGLAMAERDLWRNDPSVGNYDPPRRLFKRERNPYTLDFGYYTR